MAKKIVFMMLVALSFSFIYAQDSSSGYDDKFLEVKVKEVQLYITPTFKLVLPDTNLKIGVKQDIGPTTLEGITEYNYIYSKMNYLLKYTLNIDFPISLSLYDDINLEQLYELVENAGKKKFIQRNRGFAGEITTPRIFDFLSFTEEIKNETFYYASLESEPQVDEGNIVLMNSWVRFNFGDLSLKCNFDKAIPHDYSPYNFLFLNAFLDWKNAISEAQTLNIKAKFGYVLESYDMPIWKKYRLGGYDALMGYSVDEFEGMYTAFARVKYDHELFNDLNFKVWWLELQNVNLFAVLDGGTAGHVHDLQDPYKYHFSAGVGLDFNLLYRGKLKIKLTVALAQAIKEHYIPVFYFVQEI